MTSLSWLSFMDLTGLLSNCHKAVRQKKQLYSLSALSSKLSAILVLCLCSCMLWQFLTCLLKYFTNPVGANVAFSNGISQSPIVITICNKGNELNYTFPELNTVDVRQGPAANWQSVWTANLSSVSTETFVTLTHRDWQRLCKTIHVHESFPSELRIRHYYSNVNECKLNKMEVYLHNLGFFLISDFSVLMSKKMFAYQQNFVLELALESMISLPNNELKCSQEEAATSLDNCIYAEAVKTVNQSYGCRSKYLG